MRTNRSLRWDRHMCRASCGTERTSNEGATDLLVSTAVLSVGFYTANLTPAPTNRKFHDYEAYTGPLCQTGVNCQQPSSFIFAGSSIRSKEIGLLCVSNQHDIYFVHTCPFRAFRVNVFVYWNQPNAQYQMHTHSTDNTPTCFGKKYFIVRESKCQG